jgi:cell division protein FtsB
VILFAVVILVVVAILANIGPLTHYQDARARLDKAAAQVAALEAQRAELQQELAKLSETGYLETLAREQLTYARPGEELYIVTPAGSGSGAGATGGLGVALGVSGGANAGTGEPVAAGAGVDHRPGFLERAVSAIRGLF